MNDLLMKALRREPVPRRPLWIMRQAGRYLPEYRELRSRYGFLDLCREPELAAQVTRMPLERFPLDAGIVFADIMSPIAALGVDFEFDPGPVIKEPLRTAEAVRALRDPEPETIAPEVPATIRLVRETLENPVPILGFAGAPWTLAAYLVEGRGKREFPTLRAMAASDPDLLGELMQRLARLVTAYAIEQAKAGAAAIQIFDTWGGVLSRPDWERLVRPHLVSILDGLGAARVPRIVFLQNAPHLVESYAALPAECVAVDWRVDLAELQRRVAGEKAVQGNLDPAVLHGGPEATRVAAKALLDRVNPVGHIMNLGHGILPDAPIESVEALIEVVHAEEIQA